jgi:hypothetical protein
MQSAAGSRGAGDGGGVGTLVTVAGGSAVGVACGELPLHATPRRSKAAAATCKLRQEDGGRRSKIGSRGTSSWACLFLRVTRKT